MPTEKPRVTITMSQEQLSQVDGYRYEHKLKNQTQAILSLIEQGLTALESDSKRITPLPTKTKDAPPMTDEARKLIFDFNELDLYGRRVVRAVLDEELYRVREQMDDDGLSMKPELRVIQLFTNPAAAGPALDMTGQDSEPYTLKDGDPLGASYAIRVQGDSMEPLFQDGDIAFVNHDAMRDGDIGVFCVDGATVIKQWHQDSYVTYLFSLNRARADADVVVSRNSGRSIIWQGRVITKRRYDLPKSNLRGMF